MRSGKVGLPLSIPQLLALAARTSGVHPARRGDRKARRDDVPKLGRRVRAHRDRRPAHLDGSASSRGTLGNGAQGQLVAKGLSSTGPRGSAIKPSKRLPVVGSGDGSAAAKLRHSTASEEAGGTLKISGAANPTCATGTSHHRRTKFEHIPRSCSPRARGRGVRSAR